MATFKKITEITLPVTMIDEDENNRFVSDTEKAAWDSKEPGDANIQAHVTAPHAQSNALTQQQIEGLI